MLRSTFALLCFFHLSFNATISLWQPAMAAASQEDLVFSASRAFLANFVSRLRFLTHSLHRVPPGLPFFVATYQRSISNLLTPHCWQCGVVLLSLSPVGFRVHFARRCLLYSRTIAALSDSDVVFCLSRSDSRFLIRSSCACRERSVCEPGKKHRHAGQVKRFEHAFCAAGAPEAVWPGLEVVLLKERNRHYHMRLHSDHHLAPPSRGIA